MRHLREVLDILVDLAPLDQCQALRDALEFHNKKCPDQQVVPHDGYASKIVTFGPLDGHFRALGHD